VADTAPIAIIGAGAWGTALAIVCRRAGHDVRLWARRPEQAAAIAAAGENAAYLPGIPLDPGIRPTADLAAAVEGAGLVLLVTPAQHTRGQAGRLPAGPAPIVICAKGLETATSCLMTEVVGASHPGRLLAVLSGPTFAAEVARGLPTALTLAAADDEAGPRLAHALAAPGFRPYWTQDVVGVQLGGAMKNVLAIAAGVVMGRGLGENARAALITRGVAELRRLAAAAGAREETATGLSGLGDLLLTATSLASRNTSLGHALGRGESLQAVLAGRRSVTEGVHTAAAIVRLAARLGVDAPVSAAVDAVVSRSADIDETVTALLDRPLRREGA
jgi:glycerol-3-phosphate dehydrogenase (NAD(P)+)